jgi:hypothetical protein
MAFGSVVAGPNGRDSTLGPIAGAVEQLFFCDNADLALRRKMQGQGQPGQPATYNENVETVCHGRGRINSYITVSGAFTHHCNRQ